MIYFVLWIYLIIINTVGGIMFSFDKFAATKKLHRVPEKILHLLEVVGGVFAIFILMFILSHKNKKAYYYRWTWIILTIWIFIMLIIIDLNKFRF